MERRPTLWHIPISHYSEKVRWALALKSVEHTRHAPPPGAHIPVALLLTRGRNASFPVLGIDGAHIGDSTAIIAALEERFPEPPLYPTDGDERRRALELEDFFDEQLGPQVRQLAFHELRSDPEAFRTVAAKSAPAPLAPLAGLMGAYGRAYTGLRWRARDADAAQRSRAKIREALHRLEAELGGDDHLVGGRFGVADLTAAALFYPLVLPPGAPLPRDGLPDGLEGFRAELADRPGFRWVEETYRRHRRRAPVTQSVA